MTSVLRKRYTKLLRWYPAADRADRGVEIVDTYLDLARAGQRWPRPGDVVDLIVGGLRQHLRARNALGLADALPVAGTLALVMATVLAAVWMVLTEAFPSQYDSGDPMLGPFHTLGALAWITWLLAPLAALAGYGRRAVAAAVTVTIAVAVTIAVIPAMALTSLHQPDLFVLLPQIVLGMVALAAPHRRSYRDTAVITAPAAAAAALAVLVGSHHYVRHEVFLAAGPILILAIIAMCVGLTVQRDRRAWWPAVVLLGPVLLLNRTLLYDRAFPLESRRTAVAWAMMSLIVAVAALVIAMRWQTKRARRRG